MNSSRCSTPSAKIKHPSLDGVMMFSSLGACGLALQGDDDRGALLHIGVVDVVLAQLAHLREGERR